MVHVFRCDYASLKEVVSVGRSVGPSAGPCMPCYYRTTNVAIFEGEKSSNEIKINDTIINDDVVTSDVPPAELVFCKHTFFSAKPGNAFREAVFEPQTCLDPCLSNQRTFV